MSSNVVTWIVRVVGVICLIHLIYMLTNPGVMSAVVALVDVFMFGAFVKREMDLREK